MTKKKERGMEKSNETIDDSAEISPKEEFMERVEEKEDLFEPDNSSEKPAIINPNQLVEEAREMVNQSDHEVKDCMEILDEDISAYEEMKSSVLEGSMEKTEALLAEVGLEVDAIENNPEEGLEFKSEEAIEPMTVRDLSSGKFGAFLLALIAGIAAIAGWIYAATEKLGITLDISKVPSQEVQNKLLSWIGGGMTGGEGNPMIGMVILGVTALVVMWAVYAIRVHFREAHNRKLAEEIKEEAIFYCTRKEECKKEMEKVSEHIHNVIKTLYTYDVFFDELNAKLRRILHLEGKVPFEEYHSKSREEMKNAAILIDSLKELVSVPMAAENGSLSREGREALERSNHILDIYREKLYQ
jgi:sugar-specific transcriptional regulator TrmB